jgi:hypothetical protein
MRGRWAAGIVPRNFTWIVTDRFAVSERPGGYAPHHRRVRRQEEIFWLKGNGFTRVISLLPSNHNLHAYEELGLPSSHFALLSHSDVREVLASLYPSLSSWLRGGDRVLMHHEELNERVSGVVAGFLVWSGVLPEPPRAISFVEQLLRRQMGSAGRAIVAAAAEIAPPFGEQPAPLSPGEVALAHAESGHRAPVELPAPDEAEPDALEPDAPEEDQLVEGKDELDSGQPTRALRPKSAT